MSQHHLSNVLQRMLNRPLAIEPSYAAMMVAALNSRLDIDALHMADGEFHYPGGVSPRVEGRRLDREALDALAEDGDAQAKVQTGDREKRRKLFDFADNAAYIPIEGTLTKSWGLNPSSGVTGYDGIETKLVASQADPDVRGIFLGIDSGGGDVSGLFPLMDMISAMSVRNGGKKPIYAYAGDYAYSAAFALAAAADKVFVPETGGVGSVGVITMHANQGPFYEQKGVELTIIRSGKHKAKPHPLEALDPADEARVQAEVDRIRELFVSRVARDRQIPASRVFKTEALTYMGEDAKAIGFVDKIATEHQAWDALQRAIAR